MRAISRSFRKTAFWPFIRCQSVSVEFIHYHQVEEFRSEDESFVDFYLGIITDLSVSCSRQFGEGRCEDSGSNEGKMYGDDQPDDS